MTQVFIELLFTWPALAASLIAAFAGLLLNRPWLMVAAAFLIAPYSVSRGIALLVLPLLDLIAAWALLEENTGLAWLFSLPSFFVGGYFLFMSIQTL
jgi:hypothetical protein